MKKNFYINLSIWAILLLIFNFSVLVSSSTEGSFLRYATEFVVADILINITFIIQMVFSYFFFKNQKPPRKKDDLSVYKPITVNAVFQLISIIIGIAFLLVPALPNWIAVLLCFALLAVNIIWLFKEYPFISRFLNKFNSRKFVAKFCAVTVPCILVIAGIIIGTFTYILPNTKYNKAKEYINANNNLAAAKLLAETADYKDSSELLNSLIEKDSTLAIYGAKIGETITMGTYEQDNDTENGAEPIEWYVIERTDDKVLLLSKYALDCVAYNEEYVNVTWAECTFRQWLNNDFISTAFTDEEAAKIKTTSLTNHDNTSYRNSKGGKNTKDKIFLFSINEANYYLTDPEIMATKPTEYAISQGVYRNAESYNCWWWLRSPGSDNRRAARVDINTGNGLSRIGHYVNYNDHGVRPAMWVSLD